MYHRQVCVRACCRQASPAITAQHSTEQHSTAQHSTAQHSTAQHNQPVQSRKASACRSACGNANKRTELARASMPSSFYLHSTHAEFSKRAKKSKSAWPTKTPGRPYSHNAGAHANDLPWVLISTRYDTDLSLRTLFLCISDIHAACGCSPGAWSS